MVTNLKIQGAKLVSTALATKTLTAALASPSMAMGSGDDYEDYQVGVGYTVYEPSNTANLKLTNFTGRSGCPAVYSFKVADKKARIYAHFDPSVITNCTKDDVAKSGRHIAVTKSLTEIGS